MKTITYISLAALILGGCNNKEEQQIKTLSAHDSALMRESGHKDSTILTYVKSMNDIQDNLDSIKAAENILNISNEAGHGKNAVRDIRNINAQLLKYHREIFGLEKKLQFVNSQNAEIKKLEAHLSRELAEKDSGIAVLQRRLAGSNDSLTTIINQFNDSMVVISKQNSAISQMTTQLHTVYYAIGTTKEFKKKGVIIKKGGLAGIGSTTEVKQNFNSNYFTKGDLTQIHVIPLNSKFEKLVTNHPVESYAVTNNKKSDSLIIKDPATFWSTSKYLVVVVK